MIAQIDKIFEMLRWNNTADVQQKGIDLAKKVQHLSMFFQPIESKELWHNCAKIIASKSNEELIPYLYQMFEWLQDMNWPGADIIYNRLMQFRAVEIEMTYNICLNKARSCGDHPWYDSLVDFWAMKRS